MKSKNEIQQELIKEFGEDFNTIDNLIKWLKSHYHPQIFTSMEEFVKTPYFHITGNMTIDEYTDDYINEDEKYIIALFNAKHKTCYQYDVKTDTVVEEFNRKSFPQAFDRWADTVLVKSV